MPVGADGGQYTQASTHSGADCSKRVHTMPQRPRARVTPRRPPVPPEAALPAASAQERRPARGMGPAAREVFFERLAAANPLPQTELHYATPFQLLAAVLLSAQSTDRAVNRCTATLFAEAPDAAAVHALGEAGIARHIRTLGLFNAKARHLAETAGIIARDHDGKVPADRVILESLPGVGRKTANVLLNTLYAQPVMAVDTHIFRVANRTGLAPGRTVREVEDALMKRVPRPFLQHAHHWLILHGRYTCVARRPRCGQCPVLDVCRYPDRLTVASAGDAR
jgi:endonuclease III